MSNVELQGNKKNVILKLVEDGDMSVYDIRDMRLINTITKKRITTTGVNKMVQKLCEMGAICTVPTSNGEMLSVNKENVICRRSRESFKLDGVFLLLLSGIFTSIFLFFFKEILFAMGSMATIAVVAIYLFIKTFTTYESKSVFVNIRNNHKTGE